MTRKDYVNIAAAIRATQDRVRSEFNEESRGGYISDMERDEGQAQLRGVRRAAAHLADTLSRDNPRFDVGRFLTACGYGATTMNPRDPALDLRPSALPKSCVT